MANLAVLRADGAGTGWISGTWSDETGCSFDDSCAASGWCWHASFDNQIGYVINNTGSALVLGNTYYINGVEQVAANNNGYSPSLTISSLDAYRNGFAVTIEPPQIEFLHDQVDAGVTVTPAHESLHDVGSDVDVVVTAADPALKYQVLIDDVELIAEFCIQANFTLSNVQADVEIDVVALGGLVGAKWAGTLELHLWDLVNGGLSDSGGFTMPASWAANSNVLIPPSGSVGITGKPPPLGVWQKGGVRAADGQNLPKGSLSVDVLNEEDLWVPVFAWSLSGETKSTGVAPCLIWKNLDVGAPAPREFRIHYFFDEANSVEPPVGPTDGSGWTPEAPVGPEKPDPITPTGPVQPSTPEGPPEPETPPEPPAPSGNCPCSDWYEAIAQSINSLNRNLCAGLSSLQNDINLQGFDITSQIGALIDDMNDNSLSLLEMLEYGIDLKDQRDVELFNMLEDVLYQIVDRLPIEVMVEHGLEVSGTDPRSEIHGFDHWDARL